MSSFFCCCSIESVATPTPAARNPSSESDSHSGHTEIKQALTPWQTWQSVAVQSNNGSHAATEETTKRVAATAVTRILKPRANQVEFPSSEPFSLPPSLEGFNFKKYENTIAEVIDIFVDHYESTDEALKWFDEETVEAHSKRVVAKVFDDYRIEHIVSVIFEFFLDDDVQNKMLVVKPLYRSLKEEEERKRLLLQNGVKTQAVTCLNLLKTHASCN